jgi:dipeptidyl aminopeptidase/acylaminoacyl peptidase
LYSLDPARPERLSLRSTLHSPSLGWCAPSHTAAWLACTSRSGQEDIVLMRSDGSETRRLTDDAFKDRIASWSPDDRYLAFMSTRSGRWEIWQIGVDGSALRQVTGSGRDATWAVWSPDGTRIAVATTSDPPYELALFDPSQTAARTALATLLAEERADVNSWSSDGTLLAGTVSNAAGDPVAILVWDVAARRIMRRIELPLVRVSAQDTSFIHGTHLIATQTRDGIIVVDADSARVQRILAVKPPFSTQVSGDGRTLLVEGPAIEGDLWLMEFGAPRSR